MTQLAKTAATLCAQVQQTPRQGARRVIALAGAPASGKSTLAEALVAALRAQGTSAQLVPMDGFHLDNALLEPRGLLPRKGAPETFDAGGLLRLVRALPEEQTVYYPVFDRARDIAIAGAGAIEPDCDTIVIEGNYLLMDAPLWRDMSAFWDLSVRLDTPDSILQDRLVQRWLDHGLSQSDALARALENDLPNARLVAATALPADIVLQD